MVKLHSLVAMMLLICSTIVAGENRYANIPYYVEEIQDSAIQKYIVSHSPGYKWLDRKSQVQVFIRAYKNIHSAEPELSPDDLAALSPQIYLDDASIEDIPYYLDEIQDEAIRQNLASHSPYYNILDRENQVRNFIHIYKSIHGIEPSLSNDDHAALSSQAPVLVENNQSPTPQQYSNSQAEIDALKRQIANEYGLEVDSSGEFHDPNPKRQMYISPFSRSNSKGYGTGGW